MSHEAQAPTSAVMDTRAAIRARYGVDEAEVVQELAAGLGLGLGLAPERREAIVAEAATLIQRVRDDTNPTMMEAFLDEY
ncbi:MAG: hypothetical protein GVY09_13010, partial [Gammaproteobacteria bacterium]|nr:hypothetical protein [Gammaproteobacteria bacterium]